LGKIKVTNLKEFLKSKTDEELRKEILELFSLFSDVQDYYSIKLDVGYELELLEKYRKIVKNEFYPERGDPKLRYSILKEAISDFKRISKEPKNLAELMISYVEFGVDFTNDYGDIDERFYNNIENMYQKALQYIFKNSLEELFQNRCKQIADNCDGIGWGFGDFMVELYYENFEKD